MKKYEKFDDLQPSGLLPLDGTKVSVWDSTETHIASSGVQDFWN